MVLPVLALGAGAALIYAFGPEVFPPPSSSVVWFAVTVAGVVFLCGGLVALKAAGWYGDANTRLIKLDQIKTELQRRGRGFASH